MEAYEVGNDSAAPADTFVVTRVYPSCFKQSLGEMEFNISEILQKLPCAPVSQIMDLGNPAYSTSLPNAVLMTHQQTKETFISRDTIAALSLKFLAQSPP